MTTTTTSRNRPDPKDIIKLLNECIEACTDGERGYAAASADVREPGLKQTLLDAARERAGFVIALQASVAKMGALPENQGSLAGAARRGWVNVRRALEGLDDRAILVECIEGERAALATYDGALRRWPASTLPAEAAALLTAQRNAIGAGIQRLYGKLDRH